MRTCEENRWGSASRLLEKATLVFTAITAAREYLESLVYHVFRLFFEEVRLEARAGDSIMEVMRTELPTISWMDYGYYSQNFRNIVFFYKTPNISSRSYFWYENTPICVMDNGGEGISINYPKWLLDPESLLVWMNRKLNDLREREAEENQKGPVFKVHKLYEKNGNAYMCLEHSVESEPNQLKNALDPEIVKYIRGEVRKSATASRTSYYFTDDMKDLDKEILSWRGSEDWFRSRNLPWKRGWVFHGPPGTGKSTAVKCMAEKHSLPVISLDLASFRSNNTLREGWAEIEEYTPCFLLVEDIDAVFESDRSNKIDGSNVTFDCLLNLISGVNSIDGYFLFLTTNNLHVLDEALATQDEEGNVIVRPGRIDRAVHFGAVGSDGKRFIAKKILGEFPEVVDEMVDSTVKGESIAAFQERCVQKAIEVFWEKNGVDGKMDSSSSEE